MPTSESVVKRQSTLVLEEGGPSDQHEPQEAEKAQIGLKVTPWRLINSVLLFGVGIWKVVCSYRGDTTADALDFAMGAVWALISFWFSLIEAEAPEKFPLLFDHDVTYFAFALFSGTLATAVVSCCLFMLFSTVEKLQNMLNNPIALPLKVVVEIVILVAVYLLIWALFWSKGMRLHDSAIISAVSWDISTSLLGQPAFLLMFLLSLALSGAIVLSTPLLASLMESFAIRSRLPSPS